jgi:hypothetical protein
MAEHVGRGRGDGHDWMKPTCHAERSTQAVLVKLTQRESKEDGR